MHLSEITLIQLFAGSKVCLCLEHSIEDNMFINLFIKGANWPDLQWPSHPVFPQRQTASWPPEHCLPDRHSVKAWPCPHHSTAGWHPSQLTSCRPAPRHGRQPDAGLSYSAGLWPVDKQPQQIILHLGLLRCLISMMEVEVHKSNITVNFKEVQAHISDNSSHTH